MTNIEETAKVTVPISGNEDSQQQSRHNSDPIMSDQARRMLEIIFYVVLCCILGIAGSAANVINIIVFCKQGFNDSVNISLASLALADLGILLTLVWTSICYNPLFRFSNIEFDSIQVEYLTAGWPNGCCVRITSWITAFITFERCFCVALPMKVKNIITPQRTFITIVVIYFLMVVSVIPFFCSVYLAPSFHPGRNKTLVGLSYISNGYTLENMTSSINVVTQLSSVIIVIVCATMLIFNLQAKSQWRQKETSVSLSINSDSLLSRDKRVMRMVTFISSIFIVCYFPGAVNLILMVQLYPDYSVVGRYHNSYSASWSIVSTLEAVNSSVNILVYYNMSSKFRKAVNKLFGINSDLVKNI